MERSFDNLKNQLSKGLGCFASLSKGSILNHLQSNPYAISIHEHIGSEILNIDNVKIFYRQTLEELYSEIMKMQWGTHFPYIASMITTMPVYTFSVDAAKYSNKSPGYGVYGKHNEELLEVSKRWINQNINFLPLPFVMLDINAPCKQFNQAIENNIFPVMGFKIHPYARGIEIKDIVNSGYLELAQEKSMPILIHCDMPGEPGDLEDILINLLPYSQELKVNICIAHAGLLHPMINYINEFKNVYIDIAPWSGIIHLFKPELAHDYQKHVSLIDNLLSTMGNKIIYGGDSPYDLTKWANGEIVGKGRLYDFKVICDALSRHSHNVMNKVFRDNAIRFLKSESCE